jgi:NADP-dependent 3-hydroxy acid dehydrogenase YdfG
VIMKKIAIGLVFMLLSSFCFPIDNLKLNPKLDYGSDSLDGPLITGDNTQSGFVAGRPNYVIIYGEGCFNSKRQARRTVELYNKYRDQVHFVVVDLDVPRSPEQQKLVKQFYKGYIPHVVVLNAGGEALYSQSGEVDLERIEEIFKSSINR